MKGPIPILAIAVVCSFTGCATSLNEDSTAVIPVPTFDASSELNVQEVIVRPQSSNADRVVLCPRWPFCHLRT